MIFINVTLMWINICTSAGDYEGQYEEKDQKQVMQNMCNNLIGTDLIALACDYNLPFRADEEAAPGML